MNRILPGLVQSLTSFVLKYKTPVASVGAFIADYFINELLSEEPMSPHGKLIVLIFCGLLTFLFLEWIFFASEWKKYKTTLEFQLKSSDKINQIFSLFAETNFLSSKIITTVHDDIMFDVKNQSDKRKTDFHWKAFKLKYEDYFPSHFVFSLSEKQLKKVPKYHFNSMWNFLLESSKKYYSIELLTGEMLGKYVGDEKRQERELSCLTIKLTAKPSVAKLEEFKKLFVVDDGYLDLLNKKIIDPTEPAKPKIKNYLKKWNEAFSAIDRTKYNYELKLIPASKIQGSINTETLHDLGIFGDILGIQNLANDEEIFSASNLIYDFNFDESEVDRKKGYFNTMFVNQHALNVNEIDFS